MSTPKQIHDMDQAVAGMRTMAGASAAWVSSVARPKESPGAP